MTYLEEFLAIKTEAVNFDGEALNIIDPMDIKKTFSIIKKIMNDSEYYDKSFYNNEKKQSVSFLATLQDKIIHIRSVAIKNKKYTILSITNIILK